MKRILLPVAAVLSGAAEMENPKVLFNVTRQLGGAEDSGVIISVTA